MTPAKFAAIGNRLIRQKRLLWIVVLVCLLTIGASGFSIYRFEIKGMPAVVMAIPILVLVFAWGLLLSIYWFSAEGKLNPEKIESYGGIKKSLNRFIAWYGAVFLSLWFVAVVLVMPWFFLSVFATAR